jgi:hypothetical protein
MQRSLTYIPIYSIYLFKYCRIRAVFAIQIRIMKELQFRVKSSQHLAAWCAFSFVCCQVRLLYINSISGSYCWIANTAIECSQKLSASFSRQINLYPLFELVECSVAEYNLRQVEVPEFQLFFNQLTCLEYITCCSNSICW